MSCQSNFKYKFTVSTRNRTAPIHQNQHLKIHENTCRAVLPEGYDEQNEFQPGTEVETRDENMFFIIYFGSTKQSFSQCKI
jgi:hypothetical protein